MEKASIIWENHAIEFEYENCGMEGYYTQMVICSKDSLLIQLFGSEQPYYILNLFPQMPIEKQDFMGYRFSMENIGLLKKLHDALQWLCFQKSF